MAITIRKNGTVLPLLLAFGAVPSSFAQGKPADWRLYEFGEWNKQDVSFFYSASELRRNPDGNIEVWTAIFPTKAVTSAKFDDAQIERIAKAELSGYVPIPALNKKLPKDIVTGMVASEETANHGDVGPLTRGLSEINCGRRVNRTLSVWKKTTNGKTISSQTVGEWTHTTPQSYMATLMNTLCPST